MSQSEHAAPHPTPKQYVQIALFLAALTAIEVGALLRRRRRRGGHHGGDGPDAHHPGLSSSSSSWSAGTCTCEFEKSLVTKFFTVGAVAALVLYGAMLVALGTIVFG